MEPLILNLKVVLLVLLLEEKKKDVVLNNWINVRNVSKIIVGMVLMLADLLKIMSILLIQV